MITIFDVKNSFSRLFKDINYVILIVLSLSLSLSIALFLYAQIHAISLKKLEFSANS